MKTFDQCGILNDPACLADVSERARFLGISHEAAALSLAKEWNAAEAERAAEDEELAIEHRETEDLDRVAEIERITAPVTPRLKWERSRGGMGGPCLNLKVGGRFVGHFYVDASDGLDAEGLLDEMAEAWNAKGKPSPEREMAAFLARNGARRVRPEVEEIARFEIAVGGFRGPDLGA